MAYMEVVVTVRRVQTRTKKMVIVLAEGEKVVVGAVTSRARTQALEEARREIAAEVSASSGWMTRELDVSYLDVV